MVHYEKFILVLIRCNGNDHANHAGLGTAHRSRYAQLQVCGVGM